MLQSLRAEQSVIITQRMDLYVEKSIQRNSSEYNLIINCQ